MIITVINKEGVFMSVLITTIVLFVLSSLILTFFAIYKDKKGIYSVKEKKLCPSKNGYKLIPLS